MIDIEPGILLISDPFLKDPNFARTVVLLCEHREEGSFGFVLNKTSDQELSDLIKEAEGIRFPVFDGGPVQKDTLHFIHRLPHQMGGLELVDGIFWGGDFDRVLQLLKEQKIHPKDLRFFLGYSGWGEGQLNGELEEKSWITRQASSNLVFATDIKKTWMNSLKDLGGEYEQMTNYPIDPQLN